MRSQNPYFAEILVTVLLACLLLSACGPRLPQSAEKSTKGWIGVYVQDLDEELRGYLDVRSGVLVNDVVPDGPADKAGLQEEDVIIRVDGKTVRRTRDLTRAIRRKKPGDKVKVEFIRDGKKMNLKIRIGERPEESYTEDSRFRHPRPPRAPRAFAFHSGRAWLGIQMTDLNSDLAEYFDAGENDGVLVLSVADDSPADKAGIRAGDVIQEIDQEKIRNEDDLLEILSEKEPGDEIEIVLKRKGREMTLTAELEKSYRNSSFRFDFDKDEMKRWKRDFKKWQKDFRRQFKDDAEHRLRIEIPLQELGDELDRELEGLGRELEREMQQLGDELEELDIQFRVEDHGVTV